MSCQLEELNKPRLRRREVLQVTGLERGRIQGWEQQGFWTWPGESSTEKRLYSVGDTLRFALAAEMEACGIPISRAWAFIHKTPMLIIRGEVPYLVYVEIYRHGAGGHLNWTNCVDPGAVRNALAVSLSMLKDGHAIRGIRSSVVNVQRVLIGTGTAIAFLGEKLAVRSDVEIQQDLQQDLP